MTGPRSLELRLLGRFVALSDGLEIPAAEFGGRKVRALVRILATRRGSFVSHDALTEMLWSDRPPADPAANLQVLVNRARRALKRPGTLLTGPGGYSFAGGAECVVDTEQFLAAVERAQQAAGPAALAAYTTALTAWAGDPLTEDAYADWAADYRDRLMRARQLALEHAACVALELGDTAVAVDYASAAATAEPLREVAVLTLVRALAAAGDPVAALDRYDEYRRALADELGLDPSDAAVAEQSRLLRGQPPGRRTSSAPRVESDFSVLPFVGREAELEQLLRTTRAGGLALLVGPSGAGKSRLLDLLGTRTPAVTVRAFSAEQDEPWSLARSLFREVLAADATAAAALPSSIRAALAWLLPESEPAGSGTSPGPESRRALLVEAAIRLVPGTGCALVVDDVHWADPTSLALVAAALARIRTPHAVLAFRAEEMASRTDLASIVDRLRPHATTVTLASLSVAEIAEFTTADRLTAELATALATSTDRTPLAVCEVLRALAVEGAIGRTAQHRWRALTPLTVERAAELAIEGQRSAILARADAQSPEAREVLNLLALVAREVPARVLAHAGGFDERTVLATLGSLSRSGLARLGERGWATAHDMVGEVLEARLTPGERGRLHALVAQALDAPETDPGELARHWLGAGDFVLAAQSHLRAATYALDAFADSEATTLADAGIAAAPPGELTAALREVRAQARARLGDISGARTDLRAALRAHPAGPVHARLLARLATVSSGADDLVRAAELAESALVEAGSDPAARAHALEIAAVLDMNLDRPEQAERRAAQAIALYQQLGDARGTARILDGRAMATFLDGEIARGTELLQRAANLFEDSGDLVHVVTPRSTAGHGLVFNDRAAAGLARATSALELARTLGHPEGQTYALWHCTEALAALGRTGEALDSGREALAIAHQVGHRGWTATAWRAVGIAHLSGNNLDSALHAFQSSLQLSEHLNLFASWAAARCALVLVALGQLNRAQPLVDRALVEGPPLAHYEARQAGVELAAARSDRNTGELARNALRLADAGGMRQGRRRLVDLAAR